MNLARIKLEEAKQELVSMVKCILIILIIIQLGIAGG